MRHLHRVWMLGRDEHFLSIAAIMCLAFATICFLLGRIEALEGPTRSQQNLTSSDGLIIVERGARHPTEVLGYQLNVPK